MKLSKISIYAIIFIILLVIIYACLLLWISWPITEITIEKAGVFGDSFGLLTSLFSGLAFYGIIITILLQREELQLQRIELARASEAQERSARLMALSDLLKDYKDNIKINAENLNKMINSGAYDSKEIDNVRKDLQEDKLKRDKVLEELEKLVNL